MIAAEFGDVVLVPMPFTNLNEIKDRPAVIMSSRAFHADHDNVVLVALTSRVEGKPARTGDAVLQDWKEAGLRVPSAINVVIVTLKRSLVKAVLGRLTERDRRSVRASIAVSLVDPEPVTPPSD